VERRWKLLPLRVIMAGVAVMLLTVGFTGRAGVQVLDGATAARLASLHLHGVPGEAEYVRTHGVPAPFVHPHCHKPPSSVEHQPSPDQVLAASALAGSMHCATLDWSPVTADATLLQGTQSAQFPSGLPIRPAVPPPQG
jgi:hypothetical protein